MGSQSLTAARVNTLTDAGIKDDLLAYASDDVLTDAAAIKILTDVQARGALTANEFSSLETIAANLNNGLVVSPYVASVFTQLVDGSPANATWTGGKTHSTALGNLKVGTTAAQMDDLIGKWFLGTDMPNPTLPPGAAAVGWTMGGYVAVTASLYGSTGAPAIGDVCQGAEGDCEFYAGVIDVILNHPGLMDSMIVANANGTFGVRFFLDGNEVWETVNDELPTLTGSSKNPQGLTYGQNPNDQDDAIWVGIVEKAFAQLSATGLVGNPAVNSYNDINGDYADDVLEALTGCGDVTYYESTDASWNSDKAIFIDAIDNGNDIIFENDGDTPISSGGYDEVIADHAESVIGYDSATGNFIIRNPWGQSSPSQNWDAQFEISMAQIASVQGDFAIDNSGTDNSTIRLVTVPEMVVANSAVSIASLFEVTNSTGAPITEYDLQLLGAGSLALNGATNLATSAQTTAGQIVVDASQLGKLLLTSGAAASSSDLLLSAYDGTTWSAASDIQIVASDDTFAVNSAFNAAVAVGGTVALSSLFTVSGNVPAQNVYYEFLVPKGGGTINLNGAKNWWTDGGAGDDEVSASQLSLVTYTAPTSSGAVDMQMGGYSGTDFTGFQTLEINVGASDASAALQNDANGQFAAAAYVADTAANIFANFDELQALFTAGVLQSLRTTDATLQTGTLDGAQFTADAGLLSLLTGDYAVTVADSAANVSAIFDALNANTRGDAIDLTDPGKPILKLTIAQALGDTAALHAITNASFGIDIVDTEADLAVLSAAQIKTLATEGVTELTADNATMRYTFSQSAAIEAAGIAVSAPANDLVRVGLSNGSSFVYYFGPTDALTKLVTTNANGAFDDHYFGAPGSFLGVNYASYDVGFAAANVRNAETYYDADDVVVASQSFAGNGGWTIDLGGAEFKQRTVQADGSFDVHYYESSASFGGVTYPSYDVAFTAAGTRDAATYYGATGVGAAEMASQVDNADGTIENAFYNQAGQTPSYQNDLPKTGSELAHTSDNSGGASGQVNLLGDNLIVNANSGFLGPSGAPDDFTFNAHPTESYAFLNNAADDAIDFAPGFGAAIIKQFATAASTDIVDISGLFTSFDDAMNNVVNVNGAAIFTDAAKDTVTINGVLSMALTSTQLGFR